MKKEAQDLMYNINLWELGTKEKQLWEIRQGVLAAKMFHTRIIPLIEDVACERNTEEQLKLFTSKLVEDSFFKLFEGRKENPLHHNFQVLGKHFVGDKARIWEFC